LLHPEYPIRRQNEERFFTYLILIFKQKIIKMKTVVKQVVGIDVAQNELVCTFGKVYEDFKLELVTRHIFENNKMGFKKLVEWLVPIVNKEVQLRFVMEATGVYHQSIAYFLHDMGSNVSVILPNKISNFKRTLDIKTITDKTMADAIAQFGLERNLDNWQPPKGIYRILQQLTRERGQLVDEKVVIKNQLHAENAEANPNKKSIERCKKRLTLIDKQIKEIIVEIREMVNTDIEVKRIITLICTIKGIGMLTAATVLGETNGFELIRNKSQLTSYAGLDVKEKQSGTSVKGKPCISKRGNKHLRKAMHLPALSAIKHDERYKAIFARIVSKHGIKMKAVVAVQRKLLEMVYTIYKTGVEYDKEYLQKENEKAALVAKEVA
jgi:transposase